MTMQRMKPTWVQLHWGPIWEIQHLASRLEVEGIPAFVPDTNIQRIDPFAVGSNPAMGSLLVPSDALDAALTLTGLNGSDRSCAPLEHEQGEAAAAGRRLRYSLLLSLLFPLTLLYAVYWVRRYRRLIASGEPVPVDHARTVLLIRLLPVFILLEVGVSVFYWRAVQ